MAMVLNKMVRNDWDFSKFTTVDEARFAYTAKVSRLWDKSRTVSDDAARKEFKEEAKRCTYRNWKDFMVIAESSIKDDNPRMADYERAAYILDAIPQSERDMTHKRLWSAIKDWRDGFKRYDGTIDGECEFSSLSAYNRFVDALGFYLPLYVDVLKAGGME